MTPRIVSSKRRVNREVVRKIVHNRRQAHDAEAVLADVINLTGFSRDLIRGGGVSQGVSYARHLAMYALRERARLGPAEIGRLLNRNHATVLEGQRRIERELTWSVEARRDVGQLT